MGEIVSLGSEAEQSKEVTSQKRKANPGEAAANKMYATLFQKQNNVVIDKAVPTSAQSKNRGKIISIFSS